MLDQVQWPWCTNALDCRGVLTAQSRRCTPDPGTTFCSQLTLLQTTDGGKTWTAHTTPINEPPITVGSVECTEQGDCTGTALGGGFYQSSDWGVHWDGPQPLPAGVDWITCWNASGCIGANGPGELIATLDGGKTWHQQAVGDATSNWLLPMWCDPTGYCVGIIQSPTDVTPTFITRSTPTSTWTSRQFPLPHPPLAVLHYS